MPLLPHRQPHHVSILLVKEEGGRGLFHNFGLFILLSLTIYYHQFFFPPFFLLSCIIRSDAETNPSEDSRNHHHHHHFCSFITRITYSLTLSPPLHHQPSPRTQIIPACRSAYPHSRFTPRYISYVFLSLITSIYIYIIILSTSSLLRKQKNHVRKFDSQQQHMFSH
ncbi:hypothetical protein QBC38DRAFT_215119 [Podospora fimiseda]|uniref:Uncharacterized protein n=1 Tax=Podospora fimiseda TaxID=252190 RepID=A0AAN7BP61_9PEZI|nr:hypothetical protein QBC38DRAFT_215119 [Podospora fimiseda]